MSIGDSPPPSYQRLPQICSETSDKYRWPMYQIREAYQQPISVKTSLDGPSQSPPPGPLLRYHLQSSYRDTYIEQKPFGTQTAKMDSIWIDPIGKHGDFFGKSTYEKDFEDPGVDAKMKRIPLMSTIGLGILPLLGKKSDSREVKATQSEIDPCVSVIQSKKDEKKRDFSQKEYISKDFVPLQDLWSGETTHRDDFLIPPKGWKAKLMKPPSPELKFSGDLQMTSTAMLDYQDPKDVVKEEDFEQILKADKDLELRKPFFLF